MKLVRVLVGDTQLLVPEQAVSVVDVSGGEVSYAHDRGAPGDRSFTYAYRHVNGVLIVGWASCSGNDNFSRKVGRTIAERRLSETPVIFDMQVLKDVVGDLYITDFIREIVRMELRISGMENLSVYGEDIHNWLMKFERASKKGV